MDVQKPSPFSTIPLELTIEILDTVEWQTLLTCRQVCQMFRSLIDGTAKLQYSIALAASGMMDGPVSDLSVGDRLVRLRNHTHGWDTMTWNRDFFITMIRGHVWELYGGVLAQCRLENTFVFWQLPSTHRGIESRHWSVHIDESDIKIRDFTIDPSQDLLVIVECPSQFSMVAGNCAFRAHFRSLSSGAPHPLVSQLPFVSFEINSPPLAFGIQASGDYVGVHLLYDPGMGINQLYIWEWKTGQLKLKLFGFEMKAFSFLTESHILLAMLFPTMGAKLLVVNFKEPSDEEVPMGRCCCALDLPPMNGWADAMHVTIRSDPMPTWVERQVPFCNASRNQLFVVTMWVHDGRSTHTVVLFVPTSTILAHLPPPYVDRYLTWDMWGPQGTRMIVGLPTSSIWVCYVYGSRFVISRPVISNGCSIEVYDFNQLGFKLALQNQEAYPKTKFIRVTNKIARTSTFSVFTDHVFTSLPYRKHTFFLDHKACGGKIDAVMCTEDGLVIVSVGSFDPIFPFKSLTANPVESDWQESRQFRILAF